MAVLEGIRVVEVGTWVMVPGATAVLADHGAEVIKVEQPAGDPVRQGSAHARHGGANLLFEQVNRGKRSIALDLAIPEGRAVLGRLVATADVFVTNLLPGPRRKLRVEVDDIRGDNPDVVYVRGSGVGPRGDDAGKQGFDFGVFWARAGLQHAVARGSGVDGMVNPRPGFGDRTSAMNLAFGMAAALLHRARTGHAPVVDVSLLGSGLWSNASDVVYSAAQGQDASAPYPRPALGGLVRTGDGRFIQFNLHDPDRWFPEMARRVGREDLVHDARFADAEARRANVDALRDAFDAAFAAHPLAEWRRRLADLGGAWEPVQDPYEATHDPQVQANGYLVDVAHPAAGTIKLVPAPVEFDGAPVSLTCAPELGADTEALLDELGYDAAAAAAARAAGAFGPA